MTAKVSLCDHLSIHCDFCGAHMEMNFRDKKILDVINAEKEEAYEDAAKIADWYAKEPCKCRCCAELAPSIAKDIRARAREVCK